MQYQGFPVETYRSAVYFLRRGILFPIICLITGMSATSCLIDGDCIFEYPVDEGTDPTLVETNLTYHCCSDIPLHQIVDATKGAKSHIGVRRYNYEILKEDGTIFKKGYEEREYGDLSDLTVSYSLPAGNYRAIMWQDFKDLSGDTFYNTSDLSAITVRGKDTYVGCTDLKDASFCINDIYITDAKEWDIRIDCEGYLERPLAKITILSADKDQFVSKCSRYLGTKTDLPLSEIRDNIRLKFSYQSQIITRFNLVNDEFRNSSQGYSFEGELEDTEEESVLSIGSDYIFVGREAGTVWITLSVYDAEGKTVATTREFSVPVKRGHETIVKGNILTMNWGQSISIDPSFDGEYNCIVR